MFNMLVLFSGGRNVSQTVTDKPFDSVNCLKRETGLWGAMVRGFFFEWFYWMSVILTFVSSVLPTTAAPQTMAFRTLLYKFSVVMLNKRLLIL